MKGQGRHRGAIVVAMLYIVIKLGLRRKHDQLLGMIFGSSFIFWNDQIGMTFMTVDVCYQMNQKKGNNLIKLRNSWNTLFSKENKLHLCIFLLLRISLLK